MSGIYFSPEALDSEFASLSHFFVKDPGRPPLHGRGLPGSTLGPRMPSPHLRGAGVSLPVLLPGLHQGCSQVCPAQSQATGFGGDSVFFCNKSKAVFAFGCNFSFVRVPSPAWACKGSTPAPPDA